MKKIMNTPESYVMDMCRGIALAHPELEFVEKYKIVKKKEINADKVTLISGGGSGHEPAHAGFVGTGMLDAAVCGVWLHGAAADECAKRLGQYGMLPHDIFADLGAIFAAGER